jgi:hypothetical protein
MFENATVSVYVPAMGKNAEGTVTKTWGYKQTIPVAPAETFRADVQPASLTRAMIELWGLSDKEAQAKTMFYRFAQFVQENHRAKVVSDIDGSTHYYEIKGSNPWPIHGEAILIPVQGE